MKKTRITALLTAAAVLAGSTNIFAANFADINNVPWEGAKTYINAVADAGLMVGDYNDAGKKVFRAKDGVTYCETMQLAYTLMKSYLGKGVDSSVVDKYKTVMTGYKIPTWAQEAVAYGLDNKIVTISEIPAFINKKGVSVNATRQDVAIIFGRAISLIEALPSDTTLKYGDTSSITNVAKPYVALLGNLKIMNGDTDGNFTPKASINRAEMAVVVSKAKNYFAGKDSKSNSGGSNNSSSSNNNSNSNSSNNNTTSNIGTVSGVISNLVNVGNNTTIVVNNKQFTGNSSTGCLNASGTRILMSSLVIGDSVLVSYDGDSITSILVTASKGSGNSSSSTTSRYDVQGTLVSLGSYTVKVNVNGSEKNYEFDDRDDVYFKYNGTIKSYDKVKDLWAKGDKVGLVLDRNNYVTNVDITSTENSGDYDVEGYFDTMDTTRIKLKSSKSSSSKSYDFEDSDKSNVKYYKTKNGNDDVGYTAFKSYVKANDKIGIVYNSNGEVRKIYIVERATSSSSSDYDVEGYFKSISTSGISIKSSKSGSSKTYKYRDDDKDSVSYYKNSSSTTDVGYSSFKNYVNEDDKIGIVYDSDDLVRKVYITERASSSSSNDYDVEGYYDSISSSYIRVKSSKSGSSTKYYFKNEDSDDVTFYKSENGSSVSYSSFKNYVSDNDKIGIVYNSSKEVTKVYIISGSSSSSKTSTTSGNTNSVTSSKIKIKNDSTTYKVEDGSDVDVNIDDGNNNINDYDDFVDAVSNENKIFHIEIKYDSSYYVTSIEGYVYSVEGAEVLSADSDSIKVKCDGSRYTYDISSSCDYSCGNYKDTSSGLRNALEDNSKVTADMTFDSKGRVTSIDIDY